MARSTARAAPEGPQGSHRAPGATDHRPDLDDRKATILKAVVEEYIDTAQPVGSTRLARACDLGVSSATVRNEMASLERDGYLVHPHTSAGRIPTDKGYRYFVDHVRPALGAADRQRVHAFFAEAHGEIEELLRDTSLMLSRLTHYAALVMAPAAGSATVCSVQLVRLGTQVALAVAVLSDGSVVKAALDAGPEVGDRELTLAGAALEAHLRGGTLGAAPVAATTEPRVDRLVTDGLAALTSQQPSEDDQLFVRGTSAMAETFDAIEVVRRVLSALEQQYVVVSLLRHALQDDALSVAIGAENGDSLAECSLVVAPYEAEGSRAGTVGILGPTRMNYPQAMAAVAVVSRRLGHHFSDEG